MMNALTKTAIVMATIASASATSLRTDATSRAEEFKASLQLTAFEASFLEKASAKYDCVGNTMNQIGTVLAKNTKASGDLAKKCDTDGETHTQLRATRDGHYADVTAKEALRITGDLQIVHDCTGECDTPNSVQTEEKSDATKKFNKLNGESDGRVEDSAGRVSTAEKHLLAEEGREATNAAAVKKAIAGHRARIATDIKNLEEGRDLDIKNARANAASERAEARKLHEQQTEVCAKTYQDHKKLIDADAKGLEAIRGHLETLKLCPAAGTAASFLEVHAAQRLEAHCALSRQMVNNALPNGDLSDWTRRIGEETTVANNQRRACNDAADEVKRIDIHGPDDSPDTSSGIVYTKNTAISGFRSVAKEAIAQKGIDLGNDIQDEEDKKAPFAKNTAQAKLDLKEEREYHAGVLADEKKAKAKNLREKGEEDAAAEKKHGKELGEQATYLKILKAEFKKTFEDEKAAFEKACKASKDELDEEHRVIVLVKAKIGNLKIVGQMTAAEAEAAAASGHTVSKGNGQYTTKTKRPASHTAWCRCTNDDATKSAISICKMGTAWGPQDTGTAKRLKFVTTNEMTFNECKKECSAHGMAIPYNQAGMKKAVNTGCGANGHEVWVQHTEEF